jgi:type I restriction enzyme, S subunit
MSESSESSNSTADWEVRSLTSLGAYLNGFAFKSNHWGDEGLPIVRIRELLDQSVEPDRYNGPLAQAFRIDDGDLIFSWSATLATLFWDRGPAYLNQHLFKVTAARDVDIRFLHQLIDFHLDPLSARSHGTTMKHVTRGDLAEYMVELPTIAEQRQIAEVLAAVDDQVRAAELARAKLATIEGAVLSDLLDGVPERSYSRLKNFLLVPPRNGYSPVAASEPTGEYMLGLGCLTARGFVPRQLKHAPLGDLRLRPFLLRDGDVLISRSNTRDLVGHAGVFRDVGAPCYYPDLMMRLVPSESLGNTYLATVINSPRVRRQIMNSASGTSSSMVKITKSTVEELTLPIPPRAEQDRIESVIQGIRCELDHGLALIQKLRLLKTGLMADLLTGRVRVPTEVAS